MSSTTMEDLIAINVVIADRSYRLKTLPKDEAAIRGTAKLINEKITEYKTSFAGKDLQDYLAMVLLWFAAEASQPGAHPVISHETKETLKRMNGWIDKALTES